MPSNRNQKALNRDTMGGAGKDPMPRRGGPAPRIWVFRCVMALGPGASGHLRNRMHAPRPETAFRTTWLLWDRRLLESELPFPTWEDQVNYPLCSLLAVRSVASLGVHSFASRGKVPDPAMNTLDL